MVYESQTYNLFPIFNNYQLVLEGQVARNDTVKVKFESAAPKNQGKVHLNYASRCFLLVSYMSGTNYIKVNILMYKLKVR